MSEALVIQEHYDKLFSTSPKLIMDIGANIGRVSKDLHSIYQGAQIYCFEPYPEIFQELISRYPKFNCNQIALSDFDGVANFFTRPLNEELNNDQWTGDSSLIYRDLYSGDNVIDVSVVTAENFLISNKLDHSEIDIVKIDVEGAGMQVLVGFKDLLKNIKLIYIESEEYQVWHDQDVYNDIKDYLEKNNFKLYNYDGNDFQNNTVWINSDKI